MTAARAVAAVAGAFRRHLLVYLAALLGLVLLSLVAEWRWAFWPMLVWSMALLAHYLLHKSSAVDERWAAERVEELNLKSYDRSHIESIKERERDRRPPAG